MIKIKPLKGINIELIHRCFKNAFVDYVEPFDLTITQLKYMIERRGYDENISFGAFDETELVGFTLNGKGMWNGLPTAYDTGTGIIKEYRKKGLATKIFNDSLLILRNSGIKQYLLEVIKTNTKAYDLYKKAGFSISRKFDYYMTRKSDIKFENNILPKNYNFYTETKPDWKSLSNMWELEPSWQNSIDSIKRKKNNFIITGILFNKKTIGYGIIEPLTGDIPQFCIDKGHRNRNLATSLFHELSKHSKQETIKIINVESNYKPIQEFMKKINIPPGHGQYEMILDL